MPLQNRVTPLGEVVAHPGRGLVYGNRGCLHDDAGRIRRSYSTRRWIACRLEFRGRRRHPLLQPGRFTELFFLDEATAFAAGHRPCALCRRGDYDRFVARWRERRPEQAGADAIDTQLHSERMDFGTRRKRIQRARIERLPDGAFVLRDDDPWLVVGDELLRWTAAGYADRARRPAAGNALLITPPSLVHVLAGGWDGLVPLLHPTAAQEGSNAATSMPK
jgi:hypothetical protein